jgi:RNase H-fold protein (predicted Holliday junction resolvase)
MANDYILGISMNTRKIGLAVITGTSLIHYSSKLCKEKWSEAKVQRIIASLLTCCKDFNIQSIALSSAYENSQTKEMVELHTKFLDALQSTSYPITVYPLQEVLDCFKITKKKKRKPLKEALRIIYPDLERKDTNEGNIKSKYYDKMYEAIGVALLHSMSGK